MTRRRAPEPVNRIRCAVYTRKSSEEGLEQEFNSLDAQREAGEAYVRSQAGEGWVCLPDRYDDGGFTGGNMERPALRRLLEDIEAGRVDCVVVYKVDRLSRSLLDFARMMGVFEKRAVSFVSVTQQFNTASSMGRLVLNVLLSFAQFEREIISERTRDKIAATRRKGKWAGGHPILGYDVNASTFKLEVNEAEAEQVRWIFAAYLERQGLIDTIRAIDARGWHNKKWTTRKGASTGGKRFNKASLYRLLTNPAYLGKVKYKSEVHEGEHVAIVDQKTWLAVQARIRANAASSGSHLRNKHHALLRGLLKCAPCRSAMGHTYSVRDGKTCYRYYTCHNAQSRGWHDCPSKSVPADEIERLVVEQIRSIGTNRQLLDSIVRQTVKGARQDVADRERGLREAAATIAGLQRELRELAGDPDPTNTAAILRLSDLRDRLRLADEHQQRAERELDAARSMVRNERAMEDAIRGFDALWDNLKPKERIRLVSLLVERVDYDGTEGTVTVTFRPGGISAWTAEYAGEEAA